MRVLGLIPARGGSKGVVGKNLRLVAGEPLVVHSIRAAQESRRLTDYVVSTDSVEIAAVAQKHGCPVLMRPSELGLDNTPVVSVAIHALNQMEAAQSAQYELVVLLQPTSPIRTGEDIDNVVTVFDDAPDVDGVVSVCRVEDAHPARMYKLGPDGWMQPERAQLESARRQDLPPVYLRNGVVYAVRRSVLVDQGTLMPVRKKAYVMPRSQLANIDDEHDLAVADCLVRLWKNGRL